MQSVAIGYTKTVQAELVEALSLFLWCIMGFWTYMLHCRGGFFYSGHTDNLEQRVAQHEAGHFPGFSRDHLPVRLVWCAQFGTRIEAMEMERRIEGWSRAKKMALIRDDWAEISALAKSKGSPSTGSGRTEV